MRRPVPLHVESLESRDTPATFGTPWPDADHVTLSFAPDATAIGNRASEFSRLGPEARAAVLRAFQEWVAVAGVNIGLVTDDGSRFGTGGAVQGDPRFGDIRVGGIPLATDVLAVTAPYNLHDHFSGNVAVNTRAGFAADLDLYTVMLQEAGHALGLGNSADSSSVMYEYYQGPRGGLSAADVAAIRTLYGPRTADRYEGANGNETTGTAARYSSSLTADLTTHDDVDVYRFTAGFLTRGFTVDLRAAGLSLLTARVDLLDSNDRVLASASTTDPTANDLHLSFGSVRAGATYFVRVAAARDDAFGIGAYELEVKNQSLLGDLVGVVTSLLDETGLNDTLFTATGLIPKLLGVGPQTEYSTDGSFGSRTDVDVYRISVPGVPGGEPVNLLTTIWGKNGTALDAWVEVYDATGKRLAAEVLANDGQSATVQVRGLLPGRTYFVKVASDTGTRGDYHLSADLRTVAAPMRTVGAGRLDSGTPRAAGTLELAQTGQVHLVLAVDGDEDDAGVELIVRAVDGSIAARMLVLRGRARSVDVFLAAGRYRIELNSLDPARAVNVQLALDVLTDPTGATGTDPTGTPEDTTGGSGDPLPDDPPPSDPPPDGGGSISEDSMPEATISWEIGLADWY